jgi:5'-3' exonuclease
MSHSKITAHIDADILVYRVGFASDKNDEPLEYCLATMKKSIEKIIKNTKCDEYKLYISGKENFRDEVATFQPYKGNRLDAKKPKYYNEMRQYLKDVQMAEETDGIEADDAIGLAMTREGAENDICVSIDKDLDMIPGVHYNFVKDEFYIVDEEQAAINFAMQLLSGDSSDNIPGLYRLTGQKATKAIKDEIKDRYIHSVKECIEDDTDLSIARHDLLKHVNNTYVEALAENTEAFDLEVHPFAGENVVSSVILDEIGTLLWIQRSDYDSFWEYMAYASPILRGI